ncbi:extracellular solute-binding protein [Paenibacillus qinlingensis]|uniref:Aldouronate transport system substrate-binding protein n=1 Tax=Paenibacillus qinlingensis TaxID=1837343 RepID=A0ABU1NNK6_9BACL|nr:extracellular solute-binding protein [Paenibacillus qinlingensis]MDR6549042.1 putative aldouronate transport system substrate-binding protein [Paenibacillus qinlingensis]
MKKRILVVSTVAVALASISLLAACGKEEDSKGTEASTSTSSTQASKAPEKRGKMTTSIYDRGNMVPEEGTLDKNRWTEWINKNSPVDVTFMPIPRTKPEDKLNVLFASGEAPDLIQDYDMKNRSSWYESKQLLPLDDLIAKNSVEFKALLERNPLLKKFGTRSDGKLYDIAVLGKLEVNWVFMVRTDWLKKLGLEAPKTTDELFAVAKAFTEKDPDGNGKNDTYGLTLGGGYNQKVIDFMFGVPVFSNYNSKDGNLQYSWENQQASLTFKKKLFQENAIDKDFAADTTGDKAKRDFLNGKLGFYTGGVPSAIEMETLLKNDPNAVVTPILLPKSSFGQFSPPVTSPVQNAAVVNAKAKDPVAVIKYLDFLTKESTQKALKWGIEGEHYKLDAKGCPQITDPDKIKKERSYAGDYGMIMSTIPGMPTCDTRIDSLSDSVPAQKELKRIIIEARKLYLAPERPVAGFLLEVPSVPKDLDMIVQSVPNIQSAASKTGAPDEFVKAIVTPSISAEQAIKTSQDIWNKAGGPKVDEWFQNWYKTNKDKAILVTDIYTLK